MKTFSDFKACVIRFWMEYRVCAFFISSLSKITWVIIDYCYLHRLIVANVYFTYIPTIFVTWHDDKLATGCYNRSRARKKESKIY